MDYQRPEWSGDNRKSDIEMVPIEDVYINQSDVSEPYTIEELESQNKMINEKPELDPLVVKKIDDKYWEIVDGHHRFSYAYRTSTKKVQIKKPTVFKIKYRESHYAGPGVSTQLSWKNEEGVIPPNVMERDLKRKFEDEENIVWIKKDGEKIRGW